MTADDGQLYVDTCSGDGQLYVDCMLTHVFSSGDGQLYVDTCSGDGQPAGVRLGEGVQGPGADPDAGQHGDADGHPAGRRLLQAAAVRRAVQQQRRLAAQRLQLPRAQHGAAHQPCAAVPQAVRPVEGRLLSVRAPRSLPRSRRRQLQGRGPGGQGRGGDGQRGVVPLGAAGGRGVARAGQRSAEVQGQRSEGVVERQLRARRVQVHKPASV